MQASRLREKLKQTCRRKQTELLYSICASHGKSLCCVLYSLTTYYTQEGQLHMLYHKWKVYIIACGNLVTSELLDAWMLIRKPRQGILL